MPSPLESKNAFTCSWYMTAYLYPSALSGSAGAASGTATTSLLSRNTEDVRRKRVGIQLHEVAAAIPRVVARGNEILKRIACGGGAVEVDPAALRGVQIEVHADEDQVLALLLRVAEKLVVVGQMEAQRPVALQRRVFVPNLVQLRDQPAQAVGSLAIPALDLV